MIETLVGKITDQRRLFDFFMRNAQTRHGVPAEAPPAPTQVNVSHQHHHEHKAEPGSQNVIQAELSPRDREEQATGSLRQDARASSPQQANDDKQSWLKPALIGAALLGGGTGLGMGSTALYSWLNNRDSGAAVVNNPDSESVLQSLEDRGYHLPND